MSGRDHAGPGGGHRAVMVAAVVLLDVRLPGRSGIEVLEDIVRGEGRPPVVMLTADDTRERGQGDEARGATI